MSTWPPPWLPDWKDRKHYESLHDDDLAWQFLRRNRGYIADWRRFTSAPDFNDEGGKTGKYAGHSFAPWDPMTCYGSSPPSLPTETLEQYEQRMRDAGIDYTVDNLESWLCRRWGILFLENPAKDFHMPGHFDDPFPRPAHPMRAIHISEAYEGHLAGLIERNPRLHDTIPVMGVISLHDDKIIDDRYMILEFDVVGNLKAQLESALELLKDRREEFTGRRNKTERDKPSRSRDLRESLRCFDAVMHGASKRDIATICFSRPDFEEDVVSLVNRRLSLADEYINSERYRELIQES